MQLACEAVSFTLRLLSLLGLLSLSSLAKLVLLHFEPPLTHHTVREHLLHCRRRTLHGCERSQQH